MHLHNTLLVIITSLALLCTTACSDDESNLGDSLQDPNTAFHGIFDTITGNDLKVGTLMDDSLLTSGYTTAIIGHYSDAAFGRVESSIFSQIALTNSTGLNFSNDYVIDSVFLYLHVADIFPDNQGYDLHLTVKHIDQAINSDSNYYASQSLPYSTTLCDTTFNYTYDTNTTILRLRLNNNILPLLQQQFSSQDEFKSRFKGIRIALEDDSDPVMLTLNFSSAKTIMKAHYTHQDNNGGTRDTVNFIVGCNASNAPHTHFCHIEHDYTGSNISYLADGLIDTLPSDINKAYLEPLGGTYLYVNINGYIQKMREQHPNAVISYAELILPVANTADNNPPRAIIAYKQYSNSYTMPISDNNPLTSPYTYGGYDGTYNPTTHCYRLRISQYMQELLRDGTDYGMLLFIDGRRSTAQRTIINGTRDADPMRIHLIYTE